MLTSTRRRYIQQSISEHVSRSVPAIAGCIMLCASFLPWLKDPLRKSYSAWELPIDLGWQFRISILNYGFLCLCCAVCAFVVAYAYWKPFRGSHYFVQRQAIVGFLCIFPVALFLFQYLCVDVRGIDDLAQHKTQMLLIRQHFGYKLAAELIILDPFLVNTSTIWGRALLLVDQVSFGLLLPCLSVWLLIDYKWWQDVRIATRSAPTTRKRHKRLWLTSISTCAFFVVLLIVLGRAPAALLCEYQAKASLAAGNYTQALGWLDKALILNPELNQVAYYHVERGHALYFLHPDQQSDDSRAYLAFMYREQGDYLDAYQQLLAVWQSQRITVWVVDELSITLERLAEYTPSPNSQPTQKLDNDEIALPWLQLLTQVDATNVYGQYITGRVEYDLHNYVECMTQMSKVLQLDPNTDIQSSSYTYMALSDEGQGNYTEARTLLLKAIELDPAYWNNTAREELSGLR